MRQPPTGEERSRILERMGLRVSLKQKREPSEWLQQKKDLLKVGCCCSNSPPVLLWRGPLRKGGCEPGLQGEEERGKETIKKKEYLKAARNCVKDIGDIPTQIEQQTIFVWFILVLPPLLWFNSIQGMGYFA